MAPMHTFLDSDMVKGCASQVWLSHYHCRSARTSIFLPRVYTDKDGVGVSHRRKENILEDEEIHTAIHHRVMGPI